MTTTTFSGAQTAGNASFDNGNGDELYFFENSSSANAVIKNSLNGTTYFYDNTTGGAAQIHNLGGGTYFSGRSAADHATIVNENEGILDFNHTSSAANATITNGINGSTYFEDSSSGGHAKIDNILGATYFYGSSTASNIIVKNSGTGFIDFLDTSTAANATILNDGSALPSGGSGSYTDFEGNSTAGNSVITSINGGRVVFYGNSDGGNARLITQSMAGHDESSVEFSLTSGSAGDHKVRAGSISGSGTLYLGGNALTVGSLDLDDTVSGLIRDGGRGGGSGGSLVKVGNGTLTLSGVNTYTGGTTLVGGTLDLASVSAAGSGGLTFTSGAQTLAIEMAALQNTAQHSLGNTIAGFAADGDVIDLRGIGTATASFDDLTDVLTLTVGGQTAATLIISGNYAGQYFKAVADGHGGTSVSVVINSAPTAEPVTLAPIAENSGARVITQADLLAGVTDVDPDTLSVTALTLTSGKGSLVTNNNGTWTYTPALNDDTAASFSYTASDGSHTASSTASLDITPVSKPPVYQINVDAASVSEGNAGSGNTLTYTVTRTGDIDQAGSVTVDLSGTAANTTDYTVAGLTNGKVNFAPGASTATFTVTTVPDTVVESDESVIATLTAITGGGTIGGRSAVTANILNDDVLDVSPPVIASVLIPNGPLKIGSTAIATITVEADTDSYTLVSGSVAGYALSGLQKVNDTTYTAHATVTEGGGDYAANANLPVSLILRDGAGNQNTAYTLPIIQDNDGIDAHRPMFEAASVNGATLVLRYSEALDVGHPPATSAFTVQADTVAVGVTTVSVNSAAKTVTLGLASAVQVGQAVKVAYADPSNADDVNAVQDVSGNDAGTLAAATVTNTTTSGDTTPPTVSVSVNDMQLTIGETATVTFQFSEAVTGFALNDVTASHGQLSNLTAVDGDTFTALYTPASSYVGTDTIAVLANSYSDLANNHGVAGQTSLTINTLGGQTIIGTPKNDTLFGTAGDDTIDGKAGADTMSGGLGNDTYIVDNRSDSVVEAANAGIDTVQTTLPVYTLGANVENLTFIGTGSFNGVGNALANEIRGGSGNDVLDGKAGADKMIGGLGNDTYVVDNGGDQVVEQANQGIDTVLSSVSFTLADHVENLSLTGSSAINGSGNGLANILVGNGGSNVLDGRGGIDILTGLGGNDTFAFRKGEANGDIVLDFQGAGKATGDHLEFSGYGTGMLTRVGLDLYKITPDAAHGGAAEAETIRLLGVTNLDTQQGPGHNDILFL